MEKQISAKHLKLPFEFDEDKLVDDLKLILSSKWTPHFNQEGYEGDWNSIALYAVKGEEENIHAMNTGDSDLVETPMLSNCPYLKTVINTFQCPLLSVRLLRLSPGGFIKPHRDLRLGYEDDCFRLHIPIITNPKVEFMLHGVQIAMKSGECWYTNVNFVHSVANRGDSDRIHLVIDGQRNAWSDALFYSLVPKESLQATKVAYDAATMEQMINELKKQQSTGAEVLIKELQGKLERS